MPAKKNNLSSYIQKVQEDARKISQNILGENEKLRAMTAALNTDKLRLEEQVSGLRHELKRFEQERTGLQRQLSEIESENIQFSKDFVEIEQKNVNLANLFVAVYRLHGTLDKKEIQSIIQEIIINLIGSEELAIFDCDAATCKLSLSYAYGIDQNGFKNVSSGSGIFGKVIRLGEPFYITGLEERDREAYEENLTACIPLKIEGKVIGLIAIFRLLGHKSELEEIDRDLFDLLASHAAMALYCAFLHARATSGVGEGA